MAQKSPQFQECNRFVNLMILLMLCSVTPCAAGEKGVPPKDGTPKITISGPQSQIQNHGIFSVNAGATRGNALDETLQTVTVDSSVRLEYKPGNLRFGFGYKGELSYPEDSQLDWDRINTLDIHATVPVKRTKWNVRHQLMFVKSDSHDLETLVLPDHHSNITNLDGIVPLGHVAGLSLGGSFSSHAYDEDVESGSSSRDKEIATLHSELLWQVKPSTRISVKGDYTHEEYSETSFRNRDNYKGGASLEYRAGGLFVVQGNFGYEVEEYGESDSISSADSDSFWSHCFIQFLAGKNLRVNGDVQFGTRGLEFLVAGEFRPNRSTKFKLSASHQTAYTNNSSYRYNITKTVQCELNQSFGRAFSYTLGTSYTWLAYPEDAWAGANKPPSTESQDTALPEIHTTATWSFENGWRLSGTYGFKKRDTTSVQDETAQNGGFDFNLAHSIGSHVRLGGFYAFKTRNDATFDHVNEHHAGMHLELLAW